MISVYGGTGFIGSRFCEKFNANKIPRDSIIFNEYTEDVVYFISTVHNYWIHEDPYKDINTNLIELMKRLEYIRHQVEGGKDIVFNFISSWFVYGKSEDCVFAEDSQCNPTGFYSITKRAAEQLLMSYCETFNIKYRILRLCSVFGYGDKFSKKKNAFQYLLKEMLDNKDINLYNRGMFKRNYLHVDDVCNVIKMCIDKAGVNQIINIGDSTSVLFRDIINFSANYIGYNGNIGNIEPPKFHKHVQTQNCELSTKKIAELGFVPEKPLFARIIDTIDKMRGSNEY